MNKFKTVNNWICRAIVNNLIDGNYYAVVCLITNHRDELSLYPFCQILKVIYALMPDNLLFTDELVNQWYRTLINSRYEKH